MISPRDGAVGESAGGSAGVFKIGGLCHQNETAVLHWRDGGYLAIAIKQAIISKA